MEILRTALGYIRLLVFGIFTFICLAAAWLTVVVLRTGAETGLRIRKCWSKGFMRIVGFRIKMEGRIPADQPYLVICNHRSSLDPIILLSHFKGFPVSRADVEGYPLVGLGAKITGIMLVDRSDKDSRHATKEKIGEVLSGGHSVIIFPEGRTNVEPQTIMFRKGSFEKAAELDVPVLPVALEYRDVRCYWHHTENLIQHFFRYLNHWQVPVRIVVGDPIRGDEPFELIEKSQEWIDRQISRMRRDWDGG